MTDQVKTPASAPLTEAAKATASQTGAAQAKPVNPNPPAAAPIVATAKTPDGTKSVDLGEITKPAPLAPTAAAAAPATKLPPPNADPKPAKTIAQSDEELLAAFAAKGHDITVIEMTDPSQMYPYLVTCNCGWQGRCNNEVQAKGMQMQHLHAQSRGVF